MMSHKTVFIRQMSSVVFNKRKFTATVYRNSYFCYLNVSCRVVFNMFTCVCVVYIPVIAFTEARVCCACPVCSRLRTGALQRRHQLTKCVHERAEDE